MCGVASCHIAIWRITVTAKIMVKNGGKGTGDGQAVGGGRCQADLVAKSGKYDSRVKQMIAIITASADAQIQIYLGWCRFDDGCCGHILSVSIKSNGLIELVISERAGALVYGLLF